MELEADYLTNGLASIKDPVERLRPWMGSVASMSVTAPGQGATQQVLEAVPGWTATGEQGECAPWRGSDSTGQGGC